MYPTAADLPALDPTDADLAAIETEAVAWFELQAHLEQQLSATAATEIRRAVVPLLPAHHTTTRTTEPLPRRAAA